MKTGIKSKHDSPGLPFVNLPFRKLFFHLLFWAGSFFFLLAFFSHGNQVKRVDKVYVLLFHLPVLTAVYINLLVFIPFLLRKGKIKAYALAVSAHLVLMSLGAVWFMDHAPGVLFPDYFIVSGFRLPDVIPFMFFYLLITTLLEMSRAWFILSAAEKKLAEAEKEQMRAELASLRAQINPHFLFNSLNNLYALAIEGSEKTPGLILKLSEMLRYLLYRCSGEKVSLEEEIGFLQDYIGLQAIRSDAGSEVRFEVPDHETPHEIAPFLLLPLVENVFKHGTMSGRGESFAEISIKTRENKLEFTTSNHAVDNSQGDSRDGEMIGIRNVERRLHLLYPGAHEFRYGFSGGKFLVKLNISL